MSINLLKYSLAFGFHVGKDSQYFNYKLSSHILGKSSGIIVFNLLKILNNLQVALRFLKQGIGDGCSILYHFASLFLYDYSVRLAFSNLLLEKKNFILIDCQWSPGYLYSKLFQFFKMITAAYTMLPKKMHWMDLFIRLFSYLYLSRLSGISWSYHAAKVSKFFKLFIFFKHFKVLFKLPEIFFLWNSLSYKHPMAEMSRTRAAIISTVNSVDSFENVTYPLLLNATSLWGALLVLKISATSSK